ncbi:MAG: hydantoinase B/oxoprolinase family protein [Betaproteobacteria bacterium]|nr:hydantoinase B/oxoprolinase family protein [Betaproteobacteria bacterium]
MTNTSNLPIEVMEIEFPVRVERYEIVPDSGGAGKFRGGCGVVRDLRILGDETMLSVRSARQKFPARGLAGGLEGSAGAFLLDPDSESSETLHSTLSEKSLAKGALLRVVSPGGGGYGAPSERAPDAVAKDVREGKVSETAARTLYKVVMGSGTSHDPLETTRCGQSKT